MGSQIGTWSLGAPTDWGSWVPHRAAERLDEVASDLADGEEARDRVRAGMAAFDESLPDGPVLTAAVWVPDRTSGEVCGLMMAEILVDVLPGPDPVGALLTLVSRPPRERGVQTFDYSVARAEVPAGPAAIQARTWAEKSRHLVTSTVVWTIVPPGASEAVRIELTTSVPSMYDALIDAGIQMAHHLTVELT
ncbi:hypothetical protein BH11ACT1_BH11ACT1_22240 [soil metagenome]